MTGTRPLRTPSELVDARLAGHDQLSALEKVLQDQGYRAPAGAGVAAAIQSYSHAETAAAVSR